MITSPTPDLITNLTTIKENCSKTHLSKKWDKCLDDYENYTKEYIKQYKMSLKGNLISLSKYPYMKVKSEALCQQLYNAQNKSILTEKQVNRMSKIQIKTLYSCCA
jgi:hypothetical protein